MQRTIKAHCIDILGPPLAPTSQENLLRVSGKILDKDRAENILSTYQLLVIIFKPKPSKSKSLTLWHSFGIRHIHSQLETRMLGKLGIGD